MSFRMLSTPFGRSMAGQKAFGRLLFGSGVFSLGLVVATGFLLLTSLVVTASLSAAERFIGNMLPLSFILLESINFVFSFGMITILFALILKFIPATKIPWRDVRMGAVVTSLLLMVGKVIIGFYLGHSALTSAYGAAASLVIFLIWIYYSAQILLFGDWSSRMSTRLSMDHEWKTIFRSDYK